MDLPLHVGLVRSANGYCWLQNSTTWDGWDWTPEIETEHMCPVGGFNPIKQTSQIGSLAQVGLQKKQTFKTTT